MRACSVLVALALLAGGVAAAGETTQPAPPSGGGAKEAVPARADPRAASWSESGRPRVTPGVLVRAAKRAQKNGHGACGPCRTQAGAAADRDDRASIEIDWHAASAAP